MKLTASQRLLAVFFAAMVVAATAAALVYNNVHPLDYSTSVHPAVAEVSMVSVTPSEITFRMGILKYYLKGNSNFALTAEKTIVFDSGEFGFCVYGANPGHHQDLVFTKAASSCFNAAADNPEFSNLTFGWALQMSGNSMSTQPIWHSK